MSAFVVRPYRDDELDAWVAMRVALWPEDVAVSADDTRRLLADDPPLRVFIASARDEDGAARAIGFLELSIRDYADGCDTAPVPYVEGWYVDAAHRGRGVGRALMEAAEQWSREAGYAELGSDALVENTASRAAHERLGFEPREIVVMFRKRLR